MADDLLIVAGEASGDLHAARLLGALLARQPDVEAYGLGGDELRAAGCRLVAESRDIAVVGITEVLKVLPRAKEIFRLLLQEVDRRGTRVAVLVDSPEFNLRLAKELQQRGVRVIYYISPQIWAWRQGRVRQIAQRVDEMLVLFPFEVDFYRQHDIAVQHVGHPLLDEVPILPQAWEDSAPGLGTARPFRIALLPGSRASEVGKLLPPMLASVRLLADRQPVEVALIEAPTAPKELFDRCLGEAALNTVPVRVERITEDRFLAIAACHLALCASGTATLEVGLLGTPLVVVYRLNRLSYWLGRMLVKLPHFSLVNLVLETAAVPELLQKETEPRRLAETMEELLTDTESMATMRSDLARLRSRLGPTGASEKAAAAVERHWLELCREGHS